MPLNWPNKIRSAEPTDIEQAVRDFDADTRPDKVNLGVGLVMINGKPFTPEIVFEMQENFERPRAMDTGYLPASGNESYLAGHANLVFGQEWWDGIRTEHQQKPESIVWAQVFGGSGSLNIAANVLQDHLDKDQRIILLDRGWAYYTEIFEKRKFKIREYSDADHRQYNHDAYMEKLRSHPDGGVVHLQASGRNDDGLDRNQNQWDEVVDVMAQKSHTPLIDMAYQGLVKGWDEDNYIVRKVAQQKFQAFICVSNSKNVAANARLGSLYVINLEPQKARDLQAWINNKIVGPLYSNPTAAYTVACAQIFNHPHLRERYKREVDAVRSQVHENKRRFVEILGDGYEWVMQNTRGLFFKLLPPPGFNEPQLEFLGRANPIHNLRSSRINVGGLPSNRVEQIAHLYREALRIT
jgi:aspartate/tyrosine/aromatic aminotransferase